MFELEWSPATAQELSRLVAENAAGDRRPLVPVGGRTALHYGGRTSSAATAISLTDIGRVVDYPYRDMTITVEAGIRWEALTKLLAEHGQRLPIDVPIAHRTTVGGAVATNTCGPSRFGHGTFRDYVIGISAVDGLGRLFSAGGRVVKNVAGYDFCKLLTGSLGTLAVITQVTFKLRPLAEQQSFLWQTFGTSRQASEALEIVHGTQTRPVMVELFNEKGARQLAREARQTLHCGRWTLCLGFEGTRREVDWQLDTVAAELRRVAPSSSEKIERESATHLNEALAEYQASSDDPLTFQATVPPSKVVPWLEAASSENVALQAHAGNGIIVGHLPDTVQDAAAALEILSPLRRLAEESDGALVILNCEEDWKDSIDVFGRRTGAWAWTQSIKAELDPHGLLNRGRLPE